MRIRDAAAAALLAAIPTAAPAAVPPRTPLADKVYQHPDLYIPQRLEPLTELPTGLAAHHAFYDARAGRIASLILREPLIPGTGEGNDVRWADLGGRPADEVGMRDTIWAAILGYLQDHRSVLRVDTAELLPPRVGIFEHGGLVQAWSQRAIGGIAVRGSSVTAVINHGNLVLLGLDHWGDAQAATAKTSPADAQSALARHAAPHAIESFKGQPWLEYLPMVRGDGYDYRLVWVVQATVRGDIGSWEGLVDAATGELLAFDDTNAYAARRAIGGVYPLSNDQRPPDGAEQPGWPLPFLHVTTTAGTITTNVGGGMGCVVGPISTALTGPYTTITDGCGPVSETSASGDLDLGSGPTPLATDCAVPASHSAGDTKAARSAFYELTRVNEQARGYLPANPWLQTPVAATVNATTGTCGATWGGTSLLYLRDGGGGLCRNPGEIAGIVSHEWGHAMDNRGVDPTFSSPREGLPDIHAFLRLNNSCIGRGFLRSFVCTGYGDPCTGTPATGCTGPRDIDFAQHVCGRPHTVTWITSGFPVGHCIDGLARPACPAGAGTPCGRQPHCEGYVVSETAFDLARRDLPAAGFDANTAHELATRLFFLGSQSITNWYTCSVGGGCGGTGGYLQVLAADDDDGDIGNGTPHMTAIRAAFERHQIHCAMPAAVDSGCAGGPSAAPVLTAVPGDEAVALSWTPVAGAATYAVYRTEGVSGDTFGKAKIAEVSGTSFVASDLQNGRQYYFLVMPVGTNASCLGRMSNAAAVVPTAGPGLAVQPGHTLAIAGGDGDTFLDNCEHGTLSFTVENVGVGPLTNVRLAGVAFLTHPASVLVTTLPAPIAPSVSECVTAGGTFEFIPQGLAPGDEMEIRVDVTADELGGQVRSRVFTIRNTEHDASFVATRTFHFDADLEGWTVDGGTWTRQTPGAQGTTHHVSSSENLGGACDVIRSPLLRIRADSTLALHSRFQIQPSGPTGDPFDRANVGLREAQTEARTVVVPSGGQLYTTSGVGGAFNACELGGQPGWNGNSAAFPAFEETTWSSAAFNPGGTFTNRVAQIEIRYGTDASLNLPGFDYDEVTVENFDDLVPDVQPDCVAPSVAPHDLVVDTAGNGVLEPSEPAIVAPTWRNTGATSVALTGATSGFTGPAGPVYTNPDSSASYGTIPVAGQQSCATAGDCYSVLATAATRPVTHWDGTILETVTPTSATRTWTLHIGGSFTDVPASNGFYRFVETILHNNVTGGCTTATYCPTASTTREAMAVFALVSDDPAAPPPPACVAGSEQFSDVPAGSGFCRWIEELFRRGVVTGCGGSNYCPTSSATREQMAVFVLRTLDPTLDPPACIAGSEVFADVPASSGFCRWIEELFRRGVVTGCGGGNYCPASDVTREQMSVFLAVTFGLVLYGA